MTPHKRQVDVIGITARWGGLVLLVCLLFPAVHKWIAPSGLLGVGVAVLTVALLVGFGGYRLATREESAKTDNPFAPTARESEESWTESQSEVAPDLYPPALRRRYPWRHESRDYI